MACPVRVHINGQQPLENVETMGRGGRSPWRISGLLGNSIMQASDFEGIWLGAQASASQLPHGYSVLRLSSSLYHPPNALRGNWRDSPWSHLESFCLPLREPPAPCPGPFPDTGSQPGNVYLPHVTNIDTKTNCFCTC